MSGGDLPGRLLFIGTVFERGADGEENVRRDRRVGDSAALVCGPFEVASGGPCGGGPGTVRGWFPEVVDAKARSYTYAEVNEHRETIAELLDSTIGFGKRDSSPRGGRW